MSTGAIIGITVVSVWVLVTLVLTYTGPYWRWRNPEAADQFDAQCKADKERRRAERIRRERERNARKAKKRGE